MGIFKIREPKKSEKPIVVVADFDKLESHSVGFVLHGKTHIIRPVKVKEFYSAIQKLAMFEGLKTQDNLTDEDLNAKYLEVINTLCDTITLKDVQECSKVQIFGVFQLITDSILGKSQAKAEPMESAEKKKPLESIHIELKPVEMVTEACMRFGWLPQDIMEMDAKTFFAILMESREQESRKRAFDWVAACDVQSIALGDGKYFQEVRKSFLAQAVPQGGNMGQNGKRKVLDAADPTTGRLVESLTMAASRFH